MSTNFLPRLRFLALVLLCAGVITCLAVQLPQPAIAKSIDYKQLKLFRDVMVKVDRFYVRDVNDKELIQGALNGMLQALDPHSSYLTEDMFKELQVETKGEFEGLGIEITLVDGILTIVAPIDDTPAFKAGLEAGDKIIKIDGETTKNISLHDAVKKMRGTKGSKVTLTVMRKGFKNFKDFTITRGVVQVKSVRKEVLDEGYPYIRVVNFQDSTDEDLKKSLDEYGAKSLIKGVVLDLRNNPGGLLDQAIKVASLFVQDGVIVSTDGRLKDQRMEYKTSKSSKHYDFKVAVLINGGSASASEIVAGALQDYDRGAVFGEKSFGKASVQTIIPLDNGAGLRLTTAHYYTPKKRLIHKTGIEPDVDLKKEIEKEQEEQAKKEGETDEPKPRFKREKVDLEKDIALKKALEWLKSDVAVKQFKEQHKPQKQDSTAWYMKDK